MKILECIKLIWLRTEKSGALLWTR